MQDCVPCVSENMENRHDLVLNLAELRMWCLMNQTA